ncbi:MAG: glucuronate isomerase [Planctomycetota bacterium]
MTGLIHDDFLLTTDAGRKLYHEYAFGLPIVDYHNHLPPIDLAGNRRFDNLAQLWLEGDHYKWRAMRAAGVPETHCTGAADPYDKFVAFARTVPQTLRNPLYHWTHLELVRGFGIDLPLNRDTAKEVWEAANEQLEATDVRTLLDRFGVALLGTTDDPADGLEHHNLLTTSPGLLPDTVVVPTYRPDAALRVDDPAAFTAYLDKLAVTAGEACESYADFVEALRARHVSFGALGCRSSDHAFQSLPAVEPLDAAGASRVFNRLCNGSRPTPEEADGFRLGLLLEFGRWAHDAGWAQQLHLGALRNLHPRAMDQLGPDTGFDAIADDRQAPGLTAYLAALSRQGKLPKTVLYNLNPADNYLFMSIAQSFQGGHDAPPVPGKVQLGSGWWHLDQLEGMTWQLGAVSNLGLLPRFIGMLTDSRSFLSFARHEYFRRLLCELLGRDVEAGLAPPDWDLLGEVVRDICLRNAVRYFGFTLKGRWAGAAQ